MFSFSRISTWISDIIHHKPGKFDDDAGLELASKGAGCDCDHAFTKTTEAVCTHVEYPIVVSHRRSERFDEDNDIELFVQPNIPIPPPAIFKPFKIILDTGTGKGFCELQVAGATERFNVITFHPEYLRIYDQLVQLLITVSPSDPNYRTIIELVASLGTDKSDCRFSYDFYNMKCIAVRMRYAYITQNRLSELYSIRWFDVHKVYPLTTFNEMIEWNYGKICK